MIRTTAVLALLLFLPARQQPRLYPHTTREKPETASPATLPGGEEVVTVRIAGGSWGLVPVTVVNRGPMGLHDGQWGRGDQLAVDARDFPALAGTGLHSEEELGRTGSITGLSIREIEAVARPQEASRAGFMSADEDLLSVLIGDNRLAGRMGLTHPELARPLFQMWNASLVQLEAATERGSWEDFEFILYNDHRVYLSARPTRGFQESIFRDGLRGTFDLTVWRDLTDAEAAFLRSRYGHLGGLRIEEMMLKLGRVQTGELVPFYIMRYGFYEGHTEYRADPIAIAFIFGLRSLEELDATFEGRLYDVLTMRFTPKTLPPPYCINSTAP